MKMWITLFFLFPINVVTFVGGLILQRKWRSAMVFSGVVVALGALDILIEYISIRFQVHDSVPLEVYPWLLFVHAAYFVLIALIVILSCVTLFRNRARVGGTFVAGVGATLFMVGAIGTTVVVSPKAKWHIHDEIFTGGRGFIPAKSREEYEAIKFHGSINLKDAVSWGRPTFVVPSGDKRISGVVRYKGNPAVVSVQLFLNQYWRTRTIKTDEDGRFAFNVGLENLMLNRVELDWWFNRPGDATERMAIIVNPRLKYSDTLFDHARYDDQVTLASGASKLEPDIEIAIVDYISMIWPQHRDELQLANLEDAVLEWEGVQDAAYYEINIAHYTDEHSARPHLLMSVEESKLPLSSIPLKPVKTPPNYYIEVQAFDQTGRFLGSTRDGFGRMRFAIAGNMIVGNVPQRGCD